MSNKSTQVGKDPVRVAFANALREAMLEKGWNQAELADRAAKRMENGKLGRWSVCQYLTGTTLPRPNQLLALASALGVKPGDLLPTRGIPSLDDPNPPLDLKDLGNNRVWLKVNQECDYDTALEIMKMLKSKAPQV